jgi:hypothetical protein
LTLRRIIIGRDDEGVLMARVARTGIDAGAAGLDDILFDANFPFMTLLQSGSITHNQGSGRALTPTQTTTVAIADSGFVPFALMAMTTEAGMGYYGAVRSFSGVPPVATYAPDAEWTYYNNSVGIVQADGLPAGTYLTDPDTGVGDPDNKSRALMPYRFVDQGTPVQSAIGYYVSLTEDSLTLGTNWKADSGHSWTLNYYIFGVEVG